LNVLHGGVIDIFDLLPSLRLHRFTPAAQLTTTVSGVGLRLQYGIDQKALPVGGYGREQSWYS